MKKIKAAVRLGNYLGLEVHAGHGLTYQSAKILSSISGIHRTFIRQIARSATPSTCDKQGRIMISPSLLSYAGLKKESLILGMINKIEIWNPDILEKVDNNNLNDDPNEFNSLAEKIVI